MENHVKIVGKKSEEEEDFSESLLRVEDDDTKAPLSMIHVKSLLMDIGLGGFDTSVNSHNKTFLRNIQCDYEWLSSYYPI
ncbi:unnamed protein product [Arabidopsis halleri]